MEKFIEMFTCPCCGNDVTSVIQAQQTTTVEQAEEYSEKLNQTKKNPQLISRTDEIIEKLRKEGKVSSMFDHIKCPTCEKYLSCSINQKTGEVTHLRENKMPYTGQSMANLRRS